MGKTWEPINAQTWQVRGSGPIWFPYWRWMLISPLRIQVRIKPQCGFIPLPNQSDSWSFLCSLGDVFFHLLSQFLFLGARRLLFWSYRENPAYQFCLSSLFLQVEKKRSKEELPAIFPVNIFRICYPLSSLILSSLTLLLKVISGKRVTWSSPYIHRWNEG